MATGNDCCFTGPDGMCCVLQLVARLVGHKASINTLIPIAGKEPGAPEWILSGAADGSLGVWDLTKPPQGADREIAPRHLLPRAHEGAIYSMTLFQSVIDSPENPPVRLLTAGGACSVPCFCSSNLKIVQASQGSLASELMASPSGTAAVAFSQFVSSGFFPRWFPC